MSIIRYNEIVHLPTIEPLFINKFLMLCRDDVNCGSNEFILLASCDEEDEESVNILSHEIEVNQDKGIPYLHYTVGEPKGGVCNYECLL